MTKQCYYYSYPNSNAATRCINCESKLETYWDKSDGRPKLIRKRN